MHWFDISVIVLLIVSTLYSLIRGLIKELFSLSAFVVAFILSHRYYSLISSMISDFISNKVVADLLGYGFIFIFSGLIVIQIGKLVRKLLYETKILSVPDHLGGGILGLIKGILIIAVIMIPVGLIPFAKKEILEKAKLAPHILSISRELSKISFSDKNILENVQSKIMKDVETIQEKFKLPAMKEIMKTGLDAITGSIKGMEEKEDKKGVISKRGKKSAKKMAKGNDHVSGNITEEDKKKLNILIDNNL